MRQSYATLPKGFFMDSTIKTDVGLEWNLNWEKFRLQTGYKVVTIMVF